MNNENFPVDFIFESRWIKSAIRFGWNELLRYSHPLFSRKLGYTRVELDAVVINFLSHTSGERSDAPGQANVWASILSKSELTIMIQRLRKDCSGPQAKQIQMFVKKVICENQRQRVTTLDRKYYLHDYIFDKWSKERRWAVAMKELCEQFDVPFPPEFYREWKCLNLNSS